jgi:hypothetical protein
MMEIGERWIRYLLSMQCRACGEPLYPHEDDARSDVEHILATNDFGEDQPTLEDLRTALSWLEHQGKWCAAHADALARDD